MKYYVLISALVAYCSSFAQKTWNHRIPISAITTDTRVVGADLLDDRLLVIGSGGLVELDELGTTTGYTRLYFSELYPNYVSKKIDALTGQPFFVFGARKLSSSTDYQLEIYRPNMGPKPKIILTDTTASLYNNVPMVLETDDSTLLVVGWRSIHKVRRHGSSGFSKLWTNKLPYLQGKPRAVVTTPNGCIILTIAGEVAGIDDQGAAQFIVQHPSRIYYDAVETSDGILACGRQAGQPALLAKIDFNGQLLWTKTYAPGSFYEIKTDAHGDIFCTGILASDNTVWIQKCDNQGTPIWSKSYDSGRGIHFFQFPSGNSAVVYQSGNVFSQTAVLCIDELGNTQPYSSEYYAQSRPLRTDGISGIFEPTGSLFYNRNVVSAISPPDSGSNIISVFSPWLAGKSPDGQPHLLAETYDVIFNDLQTGFIGGYRNDFNRVWRVTRADIRELRSNFLSDGALDGPVPYDLLTWPGKGNLHNQFNIDFTPIETNPQLQSAPFVDWNDDGLYNVYDGDYPAIKGDQMLWWALNDSAYHYNSDGLPLGVDLSVSVYAYDCPQNDALKNTVMADLQFVNRSGVDYDSAYLAFYTDFDLGCWMDDYIGTLEETKSIYAYNQTAFDSNDCGYPSFGSHIPVQSITFSNQEMDRCMYFYINTENALPAIAEPASPLERLLYLQGKWKDGIPLTQGGSGYNPGSSIPADFAFPANPADPSGWNMCNANLPLGDRRMLPSKGPFTFGANDTLHTTVVFTTHHNIPHPCPDVFGLVKPAVQNINAWTNGGVMDQIPDLGAVQFLPQGQALNLTPGNFPGATYAWSTGANTPGILVTQPGQYAVTVTTEAGCAYTDAVEVLGSGSGVHAPADAPAWSISPNPASDAVTVRCADCQGLWRARLRNAMGAQVAENRSVEFGKPWSLQGLPAGVYWVELWQEGRPGWGRQLVVVK